MRKGQNPAKQNVASYQPEKLAVATLLYIPLEEGYFARAWDVFMAHLASVHQYTPEPFNYVVFDNGSCPAVQQRLQKLASEGWIDWLVLSAENLGKTGALNWMLGALPNEWICYADSDMLFRPGWLEESWKINAAFPGCGMIGAQVVIPDTEVDKGNSTFRQAQDSRYRFSQVQLEKWIVEEYCRGRGITAEKAQRYQSQQLEQVEEIASGAKALMGGNSHAQWLARRDVIRQILPLPSSMQLSRQEDTFQDRRLDELGYLHLTTTIPYLYHMGNTLDPELADELALLRLPEGAALAVVDDLAEQKNNLLWRILVRLSQNPRSRRMLQRLYNNLYQILSRSTGG